MAIGNLHRDSVLGSFGKNKNEYTHSKWTQKPKSKGIGGQAPSVPNERAENFISPLESIPSAEIGVDVPKLRENAGEPTDEFAQLMERINKAYTPETQDTNRFRGLLDQYPQREEPSFMRRLAAGGFGAGAIGRVGTQGQEFTPRGNASDAINAMDKVLYGPHDRAAADWKLKAEPFHQAANLERQENIQKRNLVSNALVYETQQERNRISEIRAKAYALKNVGYSFNFDGPTVIATRPDGTVYNTGWKTGQMDEADKENLRAKSRIEAVEALGASREAVVERQQHPDVMVGGVLHTWDSRTQQYVEKMPGPEGAPVNRVGTPRGPETGPQRLEREQQELRKIWDDYPEYRKFMHMDQKGNVTPRKRPGYGWFSLDATDEAEMAEWDKFDQIVHPNRKPDPNRPGASNQSKPRTGNISDLPGVTAPSGESRYPPPPGNTLETPEQGELKARARTWLQQRGLEPTEANIQHAIKTGRVK